MAGHSLSSKKKKSVRMLLPEEEGDVPQVADEDTFEPSVQAPEPNTQ
jgi:hypothetical protein